MIFRLEKRSGIVILDKTFYVEKISEVISDVNKFKKLNEDPALTREGQLQPFLRKVKDKGLFDNNTRLAKFLPELLNPVIPNEHFAKDSFSFCEEMHGVSGNEYILV